MGPGRNGFWLPLVRLSAFIAAVVVVGNLLFHGFRPGFDADPDSRDHVNFFSRRKARLERQFRAIERFFSDWLEDSPRESPPSRSHPSGARAPEEAPAVTCEEPARTVATEEWQDALPAVPADALAGALPVAAGVPVTLAYLDPDPAFVEPGPGRLPFAWPAPLESPPRREIDLPRIENPFEDPWMRAEAMAAWVRACRKDPVADVGDAILRGPEMLLDGVFSLAGALVPRSGSYDWRAGEKESITSRLLDFQIEPRQGRIFSDFMGRLMEREQRFFAGFQDSYLDSFAFEEETAEIDRRGLMDEQRKILWDALKKTYFSKYRFKEDRIRDDAFHFNEWRGIDFVTLPPLIAGYVYYRGLDKRISMGDTWLLLSVEPLSKWISGRQDLVAGASLFWTVKGFPLGLIVSTGLYDGAVKMDFVGIGTGVGMAKKALSSQRE